MIWEKFMSKSRWGQVTPLAPSWGRPWRRAYSPKRNDINITYTPAVTVLQNKLLLLFPIQGGSVAEWVACWTQAQKGPGSNRSRDVVG